jgi:virulence-associated protein VagC
MLTVLTQRPPLLSGNWDESYWRGLLPPELSAAFEALARRGAKAKLFMIGGSQPVRLTAELRVRGIGSGVTREVVLSKPTRSWDDYFDGARTLDLPDDFLEKRDTPRIGS